MIVSVMEQETAQVQAFSRPVSIVIPTCNGKHLLQKFLPAVLKMARSNDELLIVDDASSDGTTTWLVAGFQLQKQHKPGVKGELYQGFTVVGDKRIAVTVIRNEVNVRFAASCNRGVIAASREYILLLNNDVKPEPDCLDHLLPYFADPDVFAVGCMEYEGDTKAAPQSGKNTLFFKRGLFQHSKADSFVSGETAWVSGGSGLFDKQKWRFLGGFDEQFAPAYWEDVDVSYRARLQGWRVLFDEHAVVYHIHESTNKTELGEATMRRVSWENGAYFTKKHAKKLQKIQNILWKPYWIRVRKKSKA